LKKGLAQAETNQPRQTTLNEVVLKLKKLQLSVRADTGTVGVKARQTKPMKQSKEIVLPQTGFVRLPTVLVFYPVSRSSWWNGVKSGKYPKPYKLGPRTTAWRVEDIRASIESHNGESGGAL
jgi:prophage regulatory protein